MSRRTDKNYLSIEGSKMIFHSLTRIKNDFPFINKGSVENLPEGPWEC